MHLRRVVKCVAQDYTKIDKEINLLKEQCSDTYNEIGILIRQNANYAQNQADYQVLYNKLASKYEDLKTKLSQLQSERQSKLLRRQKILSFLKNLRKMDGLMQEFDKGIFRAMTERMTVYSKRNI